MVLVVVGCGESTAPSTPSTPTSVNEPAGKGVARGQVLCASCSAGTVIADTVVTVIDGAGEGTSTTTDQQGRYNLQIPVGPFRLRFTHQLYRTQETLPLTMTTEGVTVQAIALSPKPWTAFGSVMDRSGTPVSGAEVSIITFVRGVPVRSNGVMSDGSGRYSLVFVVPDPTVTLVAVKDGYEPGPVTFKPKCCADQPDSVNANLQLGARMLSLRLAGPTSLKVGATLTPRGHAELDDGRIIDNPVTVDISDTHVVRYGSRGLEAINPGAATLIWWYSGPYYWCDHCSGRATLQVVVTSG